MVKRTVKSTIAATVALGTLMTPAALAATAPTTYKITKHDIIFNGKIVSNPYGIAATDPNTGNPTTFMPLWYVMQALKAVGTSYTWNGHFLNVKPAATMNVDLSNLKPGSEDLQLAINDTVVQTGPKIVMKDPYSHVNSTYVPIFYIKDLLTRLGVNSVWDGNNWTMTLTEAGSVSVAAAQATVAQGQPDALTLTVKDNNGNTMNVPASGVQWTVNDASDAFVNPNSGQFIATKAGTYQVTATYQGVTSQPISINVYGSTAKVQLTAAGSLVADGKSAQTVNISALDGSGTVAANENGAVTITDTQGWLVTGTNNGTYTTAKSITVQLKSGIGSVQVAAPATAGLSDTLTASALTDPQGGATISYGTVSVSSVAQQAASLAITPVNGQKFLVSNQQGNTAQFQVTVLDQGGQPMTSGTYPYNITVAGPATYNGASTGLFVGGSTPIPFTVTSQQGETGTVTVSVSANGLQSASTTLQAVIAQTATKLGATSTSGSDSFAENSSLTYNLNGLDANGYPSSFPSTPLTAYVTNAQGLPATNIKLNGQSESSAGIALGNSQTLNISDATTGADAGIYSLVIKDASGNVWLSKTLTETPGPATQLTITPATNEVTEASPLTTLSVQFADAYNNPVAPATASAITVTAKGTVGSATINGQDASTAATVTPDANGQAQLQFIPKSPANTSWTITATANGLTSNSATVNVMNSLVAADTITVTDAKTNSTTTATAGDQLNFTFGAQDSYGNPYPGNDVFAVQFPTNSLVGVANGQNSNGITTVTGTLSQLATDFTSVKVGSAQILTIHMTDQMVSSARAGLVQLQVIPGAFAGFAMFNGQNQLISAANPLGVQGNTPVAVFVRPVDQYDNPVNTATSAQTVDLLDGGAGGYFRSSPTGANETQVSFPIGSNGQTVYYVTGNNESVVLSATSSTLDTTSSSVSMGAFTKYVAAANGSAAVNGSGTLTVTLRDQNKYAVSGQASQLGAAVNNGSGVTVGSFTETAPGVYTAPVSSTANDSGVTITVKDGSETIGSSNSFDS